MSAIRIERLRGVTDDDVAGLAALLVDAVDSGASVSFMAGLSPADAAAWWTSTLEAVTPRSVFLVARDDAGIAGTVQLHPAWPPNQPHRADVAKLMVHRRARGKGVARALMQELEHQAREEQFTLLLLDTCKGSDAERLYTSLGWQRVGEVPKFALNPNGSWCDTVFFYRSI